MTLEPQHIIGIVALISSVLVFALGLYMNRKFKQQDDHEDRIRDLELQMASHYPNRDAVDAAVEKAMSPLRESLGKQDAKLDEMSSLLLKLVHNRGIA